MKISILHLIEGAKKAAGLTVIIDVFRAFTTACYVFANGAEKIIIVGELDLAYKLKKDHPEFILMGEREGRMQPGFDYGNSPSQIEHLNFTNKTIIQTTSAGTQGIVNAKHADEIITGSFVNAQAIVDYIRSVNPAVVSLVAMGHAGIQKCDEDKLCAEYIKSQLENNSMDFNKIVAHLRNYRSARKFFDPAIDWAPERDFELCMHLSRFDFVLKEREDNDSYVSLIKQVVRS